MFPEFEGFIRPQTVLPHLSAIQYSKQKIPRFGLRYPDEFTSVILRMKKVFFLLIIIPMLSIGTVQADSSSNEDVDIKVQIVGENVIVDISLLVPATREQVWAVLTDFDHMSGFVSNLKESKVIGTVGPMRKIFQRGSASYGLINFPFESTREMLLTPFEKIQSHMVSGNMLKMEGSTLLTEEGGETRVVSHTESIPGNWIPPVAGKIFIEHETREQFQEIRTEILKRKAVLGDLKN